MGRIKFVLHRRKIPTPQCNNRITLELCENIHLHYRNIRIEFTKDEFLHILELLQNVDKQLIKDFQYNDYAFVELIKDFGLPDETYYNNRLQIEQQIEGHYHIHYRNIRLEFQNLNEIGISRFFFAKKFLKYTINEKLKKIKILFLHTFFSKKAADVLLNDKRFTINEQFFNNYLLHQKIYKYSLSRIKLKKLKVKLFVKEGQHSYPIRESPAYKYLLGDKNAYIDYIEFKNKKTNFIDHHSLSRFNDLINSINFNGYLDNNPIIINENNEIIDGQHRASYLLRHYGSNYKVNTLKIIFASPDPLSTISFHSISNVPIDYQIFFTTQENEEFNEINSVHKLIKRGRNNVLIGLPYEKIYKLRLDFGQFPGKVTISNLKFTSNHGVHEFKDYTQFKLINIDSHDFDYNKLTIISDNQDPQLLFPLFQNHQ